MKMFLQSLNSRFDSEFGGGRKLRINYREKRNERRSRKKGEGARGDFIFFSFFFHFFRVFVGIDRRI